MRDNQPPTPPRSCPRIKNRVIIVSISVIILAFASILTIWSVSSPLQKIRYFNKEYGNKKEEPCDNNPALETRIKEISYLEAYNTMAQYDSIGFIANLTDSVALLVLKGVVIHTAKIKTIGTDGFFKSLDICSYQNLFSLPLEITNQNATVEKEPIVIKKAPDSEEEASNSAYLPDTLKNKRLTNIELQTKEGFYLIIHDESEGCEEANRNVSMPGETLLNLKRLFLLKKPEYHPSIHICLERNDALSIYRALPTNAMMIIKI